MKIDIERSLDLPLAAPLAWRLLEDIDGLAGCLPGAKITAKLGANRYKGTVAVKLGPASMNFRGEIELEMDAAAGEIRAVGKGSDAASSAATLTLAAVLKATGAQACQIVGKSEITVQGKAASFGSRLINGVAEQVIGQFYANLLMQAEALRSAQPAIDAAPLSKPVSAPAGKLNLLAVLWAMLRNFVLGRVSA